MIWYIILPVYLVITPALSRAVINDTESWTRMGYCTTPPYPDNGRYDIAGGLGPDNMYMSINGMSLNVKVYCDPGYAVNGNNEQIINCTNTKIPQCERYCELIPHHSVEYTCLTRQDNSTVKMPCSSKMFLGTTIVPRCKATYYGSPSHMHCTENGWDYVATCASSSAKGTNITILTKDKVEIYINTFKYANESTSIQNETLPSGATQNDAIRDHIDEIFWRFGNATENNDTTSNEGKDISSNKNKKGPVNIKFENGIVQITTADIVININT